MAVEVLEAAAFLGISRTTLELLVCSGRLPVANITGRRGRRIPRKAVLDLAQRGLVLTSGNGTK